MLPKNKLLITSLIIFHRSYDDNKLSEGEKSEYTALYDVETLMYLNELG